MFARHVSAAVLCLLAAVGGAEDRGSVLHEYWLGIAGNALSGLTSDARYPANPSGISLRPSFATPVNMADSYGSRVRGYVYPPVTGIYRFWVAGDDQCELWLSTTDQSTDKVLIASTYSYTAPQEWTKYASQQSVEITLQAGSRYYIEALHKEGTGLDSLAVAWAYPGTERQVIPGEFLSPAAPLPTPGAGTGFVQREWWSGLTGTAIANLTSAATFPASPTGRDYLASFEAPVNWGDNYGTRIRGFLKPTQTGDYRFWVSGDDNCQLWLSADADPLQKGLIASVPGWTTSREWTKYPQQQSGIITLQAGSTYYIEALQKDGGGGDSLAVAWTGPGVGETPTVISGSFLSPADPANPVIPPSAGSGSIAVESWSGISGNALTALTSSAAFPLRPTSRGVLTSFKAQTNAGDNYGRRVRGYVCPAITGTYRFWIASDDEGDLRLSADENPANAIVIARAPTWTGEGQWDKFPEQQSAAITLTGGQRYYIEARQKEGTGGDHVAVAWVGPSLAKGVIPGAYLAPLPLPIIDGARDFSTSTTVTLSATVPDVAIRYTTDGSTPTATSDLYASPITLNASAVITAAIVDINGVVGEATQAVFLKQGTGTGLAGSYFAGEALQGAPVQRLDPELQFVWGTAAPISGIPADHFSARWQGEIETQLDEDYTLIIRSDDGARVWLDGYLVVNDWTYHGAKDATCTLPPGRHAIAIEYMEGVGSAVAQMFWQSAHQDRRIVPSTQLYQLQGVQGTIPPTSPVSPVYLEITHETGATLNATVAGNVFTTHHLDDTIQYLNVPLDPIQPTAVSVGTGAGASLAGDITWAPTYLVGNTETVIRKGDSLLLQLPQAGSLSITNYSGTYLGPIAVTAGQRLPMLFAKAGEFTVRFNVQGVETATLDVTVVTADLSRTILCEVGYTRTISVEINPFDAPLTFTGNSQLSVTTVAIAQDLANLTISPLRRGTPRLQARIHGAHGPLVAEQAIDEFTIDNAALRSATVNAQTGIGTAVLVMRPYIPEQQFTLTMFAHTATFKGGATKLTISSTGGPSSNGEPPMVQKFDTATNETIGVFRFDLEVPQNESKYCFRVARRQEGEVPTFGAYLPNSSSIFGLQASLPASAISLMMGDDGDYGGDDGPTSNVNGDVCHVLAFASLIFTRAVDESESEINKSSNSEVWSSRQLSLVTSDYCEKGTKGDGNCNAVSYKLKISDPPSYDGLDNPLAALFGGSNKESDCKTCSGNCGAVTPALDTGTIPGKYTTSIEVCGTGSGDTLGDGVGGVLFVSKLDMHGEGSSRAKFPDYTEALKRRKGTVYEPVIQIDSGGDGSVNGCSLYGWMGNPDCTTKNKWSFTAVAHDVENGASNIPTAKGYSIKWKNIPGHEDDSSTTLTDVEFPVGRYFPRLEVWYSNPAVPAGQSPSPVLVGVAEIHSIVVEPSRAANVGGKNPDVPQSQRYGIPFYTQNDAGGQAVDARMSVLAAGEARGRVSLDGYPQNEYWVTAGDSGDLAQVVTVQDGESARYYVQGYNKPSSAFRDLTVVSEGQALIENCIGCSLFQLGPVNAEWQETDNEKITSAWMIKPAQSDGSSSSSTPPEPPVVAAAGSSLTVHFEKYIDIYPPPSSSTSSSNGDVDGDFIRFVRVGGADVTQTLAEYEAHTTEPETRVSKIAITGQRYQGGILTLDLEIGPGVALDWYNADANWGSEHAYPPSETAYGSDGTVRIHRALKVVAGPKFDVYRTGENFGTKVTDEVRQDDTAADVILLTNNNFDDHLAEARFDYDDEHASIGSDHDLMRLALKQGNYSGTLKLETSDQSVVVFFKSDGTRLEGSELTATFSDSGSSSGYLGDLATHDVDVWIEGRHDGTDVTVNLILTRDGAEVGRDKVHLKVVKPVFLTGSSGEQDALVVYSRESALILSNVINFEGEVPTDAPKFDRSNDLIPFSDTFRGTISLKGLEGDNVESLKLISDLDSLAVSIAGGSSSADASQPVMLYDDEGKGPISSNDKSTIRANLGCDSLAKNGARFELTTAHDHFVRLIPQVVIKAAEDAAGAPTGQFGGRTLIIKSSDPATASLNSQNCFPDNGKTKWRLLEKPDASQVTENGQSDASYSITADLLGFYRVEMTYKIGSQEYAVPVIVVVGQPDRLNEGP